VLIKILETDKMILWANYDKLFRAFKQENKYRFGLLSKKPIIKQTTNIKEIPLIDGILYLFKHQTKKEALNEALKNSLKENHQFIKKNLKHLNQAIHLELYTIHYDEKQKRVLLQPNKKYIKYLLNELHKTTHTKYPYRRMWFGKVNRLIRYLKRITEKSYVLPLPEQKQAWQRKIKKWIIEGLTSIYHIPKKEAEEIYKKFAKKLYWED